MMKFLKEADPLPIKEIFEKRLTALDALRRQSKTVKLATANRDLNRYSDILPFDGNVLKIDNGYINASYLTSLYGNAKYIAAQGPLPNTVDHFWEMVWKENCHLIVMLTPLKEGSRVKCHDYWRGSQAGVYSITLQSESEAPVANTIIRKLVLTRNGQDRTISQIHFTGWPDHQKSNPDILLKLIGYYNELADALPSFPAVVHCSAGVGRTGTFCAIDGLVKDLNANLNFGPFYTGSLGTETELAVLPRHDLIALTVNHLRDQRVNSVQSLAQFGLIYQCLGLMEKSLLSA